MSNMSYCRFRNTYNDMLDCIDHIDEVEDEYEPISREEHEARLSLIQACADVLDRFNVDFDGDDLSDAMKSLEVDFKNAKRGDEE